MTDDRSLWRRARRAGVLLALGVWFGATALSQLPERSFDRLRRYDPFGPLMPDWRFFAPEPAREDYHLLYRYQRPNGEETPWLESEGPARRNLVQVIWHPGRRREKAVFDACTQLLRDADRPGRVPEGGVAYRLLAAYIREQLGRAAAHDDIARFQFVVAQGAGYDPSQEPKYLFLSQPLPFDLREAA